MRMSDWSADVCSSVLVVLVAQHVIMALADRRRAVVPRLVAEMRVGRHRIDFDAEALKRFILVGEVFELGRADEGEVGGIEEENRPLARNIGVRAGDELALLVRGGAARFDGTTDDTHGRAFPLFSDNI